MNSEHHPSINKEDDEQGVFSLTTDNNNNANFSQNILENNSSNDSSHQNEGEQQNWTIHYPLLIILATFCVCTVFGNGLVIIAVLKRNVKLHTKSTNTLIISLAVADGLVGLVVMPLAALFEATQGKWLLGNDMCDLWKSLDVLASTASILNLSVIALDRYYAITDPLTYSTRLVNRHPNVFVFIVWTCSSLISFPAIAWWRTVDGVPDPENRTLSCEFTSDLTYLIISSLISFYMPLFFMAFAYMRIYMAAIKHNTQISSGYIDMGNGHNMRIHKGCSKEPMKDGIFNKNSSTSSNHQFKSSCHNHNCQQIRPEVEARGHNTRDDNETMKVVGRNSTNHLNLPLIIGRSSSLLTVEDLKHKESVHKIGKSSSVTDECIKNGRTEDKDQESNNVRESIERSPLPFSQPIPFSHLTYKNRLSRFAREQKAAKTLGLVMGVFIICWLPFFAINVVSGFCHSQLCLLPHLVNRVVNWLGWVNSSMNPFIYACFSKKIRKAFCELLCCDFKVWRNKTQKLSNNSNEKKDEFQGYNGNRAVTVKSYLHPHRINETMKDHHPPLTDNNGLSIAKTGEETDFNENVELNKDINNLDQAQKEEGRESTTTTMALSRIGESISGISSRTKTVLIRLDHPHVYENINCKIFPTSAESFEISGEDELLDCPETTTYKTTMETVVTQKTEKNEDEYTTKSLKMSVTPHIHHPNCGGIDQKDERTKETIEFSIDPRKSKQQQPPVPEELLI